MAAEIDKSYEGMAWVNGLYDHPHPLRLDVYSVCSFRCLYCNASFRRACSIHKDSYMRKAVRSVDPAAIIDLYRNPQGPFRHWVQQRKELQIGVLSDQFDGFEKVYGVTLELLRYFREIDLPIAFSTKSAWWVHDERYAELFRDNPKWKVRFSFGALDDEMARELEGGAGTPSEKIKAMETLASMGGVPIFRLHPLIPSDGILDRVESFIVQARDSGAKRVECTVLELNCDSEPFRKALPNIRSITGLKNLRDYPTGGKRGWEKMIPIKRVHLLEKVKSYCDSNGMRFDTADRSFFHQNREQFMSYWKESLKKPVFHGKWKDAVGVALDRGRVQFSDIRPEIELVFGSCRANLWRSGNLSMVEYFRRLWNDPTNPVSPQTLYPQFLYAAGAQDEDGNVVYFRKDKR